MDIISLESFDHRTRLSVRMLFMLALAAFLYAFSAACKQRAHAARDIDLPGGGRAIRRVEFRYGNLPGGGKAQIELWGR